jgi:hypothetical protein
MDDLMNSHSSIEEHKEWIIKILDLCVEHGIKLAPKKCKFFQCNILPGSLQIPHEKYR